MLNDGTAAFLTRQSKIGPGAEYLRAASTSTASIESAGGNIRRRAAFSSRKRGRPGRESSFGRRVADLPSRPARRAGQFDARSPLRANAEPAEFRGWVSFPAMLWSNRRSLFLLGVICDTISQECLHITLFGNCSITFQTNCVESIELSTGFLCSDSTS